MSLNEAFDRLLPSLEDELQDIVRSSHHSLATYYGMMHYHMGWVDEDLRSILAQRGKRVRPVLCLLINEALGGDPQQAVPAACAVELIHNFSLVHDDIQDASHFRRGRQAVWDIWGIEHGINVGDGLFVLAHMALHRLDDRGVALSRQQAATVALDRACLSLCEGQYFDMTFEVDVEVDLHQYSWMSRKKTAALLAAAAQLGAIIATDDTEQIDHCFRFGESLGMAFQVQDDILGVWGDEQVMGKSAATDIRTKKKALPAVYALNQSHDRDAARKLAALYAQDEPLDEGDIEAVLEIFERVGARQYAKELAQEYHQRALLSLDQAGINSAAQEDLRELAGSLLIRKA